MIVIGICGPAGAGKSTAAKMLVEQYGAHRYSFAAPLKEIARRTLGFTREQVYGSQEEKEAIDPRYGFSPRQFLQRLGTDGIRAVLGDDFWVNATLDQIRRDRPAIAVIDDLRFANESRVLLTASGLAASYAWRLHPPGGVRASADPGTHRSELEWSLLTATHELIPQSYGLEELEREVRAAARSCGLEGDTP